MNIFDAFFLFFFLTFQMSNAVDCKENFYTNNMKSEFTRSLGVVFNQLPEEKRTLLQTSLNGVCDSGKFFLFLHTLFKEYLINVSDTNALKIYIDSFVQNGVFPEFKNMMSVIKLVDDGRLKVNEPYVEVLPESTSVGSAESVVSAVISQSHSYSNITTAHEPYADNEQHSSEKNSFNGSFSVKCSSFAELIAQAHLQSKKFIKGHQYLLILQELNRTMQCSEQNSDDYQTMSVLISYCYLTAKINNAIFWKKIKSVVSILGITVWLGAVIYYLNIASNDLQKAISPHTNSSQLSYNQTMLNNFETCAKQHWPLLNASSCLSWASGLLHVQDTSSIVSSKCNQSVCLSFNEYVKPFSLYEYQLASTLGLMSAFDVCLKALCCLTYVQARSQCSSSSLGLADQAKDVVSSSLVKVNDFSKKVIFSKFSLLIVHTLTTIIVFVKEFHFWYHVRLLLKS